ncbi:hypothetical protein KSP39_PZI019551 [Platanthera zijinensis]|uniref:DUF1421 domain-containing protein n=1 Tax=Platanthera zijinensis TaxID=2320716 RepID=A0AAP0B0U1_9ASPA
MDSSGTSVSSEVTQRSVDFLSDGGLCSYDECALQLDPTINVKQPDPAAKDLDDNGVRSPANLYEQTEFSSEDVVSAMEKCMGKYADNLMMHLEGIDGRLTQLELYCHKLEQSIGDFRTDMIHDHGEGDLKLKSLEKHLHEVYRSVKIIRDKQELSETPKELVKLLLSPRESTNSTQPQKNSEGLNSKSPENQSYNDRGDVSNQHLTLPLPLSTSAPDQIHHTYKDLPVQQPVPISLCVLPQDHYFLNQASTYFFDHHHPHPQCQKCQNLQPKLHYAQQMPQMRDLFVQDESKQHPSGLQHTPNDKVIARGLSNHPLEDMIEKAVGMGYPRDQVLSAVLRIAESGQPLDLNLFLGRLKTLASGGLRPVPEA